MRISWRLAIILIVIIVIPNLMVIYLLETGMVNVALNALIVESVIVCVLIKPISKFLAYIVVGRDLGSVNKLFKQVRGGSYEGYFYLPLESEDENELVRLKRNMNWMLHAVASREKNLHSRLEAETLTKREYEKMSYVDGLTGIFNRRYFDENFSECIECCISREKSIALMLIDCDGFKEVNDNYGHQAGDEVLVRLGALLKKSVRAAVDYPFRYGGDEFGIILKDIEAGRLHKIAEDVRSKFVVGNEFGVTLSIGIALCGSRLGEQEIQKIADEALYCAKNSGKNRIVLQEG